MSKPHICFCESKSLCSYQLENNFCFITLGYCGKQCKSWNFHRHTVLFGVYASIGYAAIQNSIKMILKLLGRDLKDKKPRLSALTVSMDYSCLHAFGFVCQ